MGKARRLQKQAKSGGAVTASKATAAAGEDFYAQSKLDVGDAPQVVKLAPEQPHKKRLTARQKKKLEKVCDDW